ncbi:MAG: DUF3093 domain-containing protein [Micromonosporaceae bacterium]
MRAYDERLSVPLTWWLTSGLSVAILGAELWAGLGMVAAIITYALLAALVGGTLLHWGSARVRVTGGELLTGRDRLALSSVGEVLALDERQARALRGQRADPAAHLVIRPYLKRAVYIEVTGPGHTAPYWLVATRRPEELAAAVARATANAGPARTAPVE